MTSEEWDKVQVGTVLAITDGTNKGLILRCSRRNLDYSPNSRSWYATVIETTERLSAEFPVGTEYKAGMHNYYDIVAQLSDTTKTTSGTEPISRLDNIDYE